MRCGFTTGSCAAAAAKAAVYMLLGGQKLRQVTIMTPKGIPYQAEIEHICREDGGVSCSVKKDGGDDPDRTTGLDIYVLAKCAGQYEDGQVNVRIHGGKGVGIVTRPGLDQPVGSAAINHVPRQMITSEVRQVCQVFDFHGTLDITVFVPSGEETAAQTFNPVLGIEGGISILGTSGIVEPMSSRALLDTIKVQLRQRRAMGYDHVVLSPGNMGQHFVQELTGCPAERVVPCSNFIGESLDMCRELDFERVLLAGHLGKLIKISGGIMNTHSHEADCRMELLAAAALRAGAGREDLLRILDCISTDAAARILAEAGLLEKTAELAAEKMVYYLNRRTEGKPQVSCLVFDTAHGLLAESGGMQTWYTLLEREADPRI